MPDPVRGPRIAIIGGGIGGLAAAAFLRRAGLTATVHEQAAALTEVGAGLVAAPNAVRLMRRLGVIDRFLSRAVPLDWGWEFRRWEDGKVRPTRPGWRAVSRSCTGPTCRRWRSPLQVRGCITRSAMCWGVRTTCRTPRHTRSYCRMCSPSTHPPRRRPRAGSRTRSAPRLPLQACNGCGMRLTLRGRCATTGSRKPTSRTPCAQSWMRSRRTIHAQ